MLARLLAIALLMLSAGISRAPVVTQDAPPALSAAEREACERQGNFVAVDGIFARAERCITRFKDGGKRCTGERDCRGRCALKENPGARKLRDGDTALGYCASDDRVPGCYTPVEHARVQRKICAE